MVAEMFGLPIINCCWCEWRKQ